MEAAGIDLGRFDTGRWKGAAGASSSSLSWDSLLTKDQSLSSKSPGLLSSQQPGGRAVTLKGIVPCFKWERGMENWTKNTISI